MTYPIQAGYQNRKARRAARVTEGKLKRARLAHLRKLLKKGTINSLELQELYL